MSEVSRMKTVCKISIFSIDERVFVKSEDRFNSISGRNVKITMRRSLSVWENFVSYLSTYARTNENERDLTSFF